MRSKWKLPWHVRQYVKKEIEDYKSNKKLLSKITVKSSISTREIALMKERLLAIEKVLDNLSAEEREDAEIIFWSHYTQVGAEIAKGISKAAYYTCMNKIIYLVAKEMDLI